MEVFEGFVGFLGIITLALIVGVPWMVGLATLLAAISDKWKE